MDVVAVPGPTTLATLESSRESTSPGWVGPVVCVCPYECPRGPRSTPRRLGLGRPSGRPSGGTGYVPEGGRVSGVGSCRSFLCERGCPTKPPSTPLFPRRLVGGREGRVDTETFPETLRVWDGRRVDHHCSRSSVTQAWTNYGATPCRGCIRSNSTTRVDSCMTSRTDTPSPPDPCCFPAESGLGVVPTVAPTVCASSGPDGPAS